MKGRGGRTTPVAERRGVVERRWWLDESHRSNVPEQALNIHQAVPRRTRMRIYAVPVRSMELAYGNTRFSLVVYGRERNVILDGYPRGFLGIGGAARKQPVAV